MHHHTALFMASLLNLGYTAVKGHHLLGVLLVTLQSKGHLLLGVLLVTLQSRGHLLLGVVLITLQSTGRTSLAGCANLFFHINLMQCLKAVDAANVVRLPQVKLKAKVDPSCEQTINMIW